MLEKSGIELEADRLRAWDFSAKSLAIVSLPAFVILEMLAVRGSVEEAGEREETGGNGSSTWLGPLCLVMHALQIKMSSHLQW
jgi:hypothetical protein